VTRGRFPQRAGSPGLNGGGTAAAVPRAKLLLWKCTVNVGITIYQILYVIQPTALKHSLVCYS